MRLISRLVLNAQLYDPVPPRPASTPGVKPSKGPRQPKLSERLTDSMTVWKTCEVTWYGQRTATIELATGTALWHTDGSAPLPLRWVLVRNVPGRRPPLALFCTDPTTAAEQMVAWYVDRWHIETTFEEVRAHLGLETQREWSTRAVGRAVPCVLGLFSVVVLLAQVLHPEQLPTRRAAFGIAGAGTAVLLAASLAGIGFGNTATEADRSAERLDAYNNYGYQPLYRYGSCFVQSFAAFDDKCLAMAQGKSNVLLWGDSLAAHYFHGLEKTADKQRVNILQATQAACMPTLAAASQGVASCRQFAARMETFFAENKPDLVIMSADWGEYARGSRFDGMIADLRQTVARLTAAGMRVVLLGPPVQFRSRLPSMLMRAELRHAELRADDFVLPDIFAFDARMREALPPRDKFAYVSVVNAVCPARQCPLTIGEDVPLAWDHAHLTAEGSEYVIERIAPLLGLTR